MSKESSTNGIGVFGLLGVAFVVLKLTKVIDWSWWWVTAPFWIGIVLALLFILVWSIASSWIIDRIVDSRAKKRRSKFEDKLRLMQEDAKRIKNK